MKLKSIRLKNFRLFKDEIFEFKPLTILTGPNSSGKSTVVKALNLLQENLKEPNCLGRLTFDKGSHQLGSFSSTLRNNAETDEISFCLSFDVPSRSGSKKNNEDILIGVSEFRLTYLFKKDVVHQPENGLLFHYKIEFLGEGSWVVFLDARREDSSIKLFLNLEWLIDSHPNLLSLSIDSNFLLNRVTEERRSQFIEQRQNELEEEKKKKVEGVIHELKSSEEYSNKKEEIQEINSKLSLLDTEPTSLLQKEIEGVEAKYKDNIEEAESKQKQLKIKLDQLDWEIKALEKQKEDSSKVESNYEDVLAKFEKNQEELYELNKKIEDEKNRVIKEKIDEFEGRILSLEGTLDKQVEVERKRVEEEYNSYLSREKIDDDLKNDLSIVLRDSLNRLFGTLFKESFKNRNYLGPLGGKRMWISI